MRLLVGGHHADEQYQRAVDRQTEPVPKLAPFGVGRREKPRDVDAVGNLAKPVGAAIRHRDTARPGSC